MNKNNETSFLFKERIVKTIMILLCIITCVIFLCTMRYIHLKLKKSKSKKHTLIIALMKQYRENGEIKNGIYKRDRIF